VRLEGLGNETNKFKILYDRIFILIYLVNLVKVVGHERKRPQENNVILILYMFMSVGNNCRKNFVK
jgi:hypothetical protein